MLLHGPFSPGPSVIPFTFVLLILCYGSIFIENLTQNPKIDVSTSEIFIFRPKKSALLPLSLQTPFLLMKMNFSGWNENVLPQSCGKIHAELDPTSKKAPYPCETVIRSKNSQIRKRYSKSENPDPGPGSLTSLQKIM